MLTREEYEAQKRRLAEQHRSLTEMVDAAYQTQLRALDMVWRMLSGEGAPEPSPPAPLPPPATSPPRRRLGPGELKNDIAESWYKLPDVFVFSDVYQAIGYTPDRGSLHRALHQLKDEGNLVLATRGTGTQPAYYRKLVGAKGEAGS